MFKHSPRRNQRSKGFKVKHALQVTVVLAICIWLIYQVQHSNDKKVSIGENSKFSKKVSDRIDLGRKDLSDPVREIGIEEEKEDGKLEEVVDMEKRGGEGEVNGDDMKLEGKESGQKEDEEIKEVGVRYNDVNGNEASENIETREEEKPSKEIEGRQKEMIDEEKKEEQMGEESEPNKENVNVESIEEKVESKESGDGETKEENKENKEEGKDKSKGSESDEKEKENEITEEVKDESKSSESEEVKKNEENMEEGKDESKVSESEEKYKGNEENKDGMKDESKRSESEEERRVREKEAEKTEEGKNKTKDNHYEGKEIQNEESTAEAKLGSKGSESKAKEEVKTIKEVTKDNIEGRESEQKEKEELKGETDIGKAIENENAKVENVVSNSLKETQDGTVTEKRVDENLSDAKQYIKHKDQNELEEEGMKSTWMNNKNQSKSGEKAGEIEIVQENDSLGKKEQTNETNLSQTGDSSKLNAKEEIKEPNEHVLENKVGSEVNNNGENSSSSHEKEMEKSSDDTPNRDESVEKAVSKVDDQQTASKEEAETTATSENTGKKENSPQGSNGKPNYASKETTTAENGFRSSKAKENEEVVPKTEAKFESGAKAEEKGITLNEIDNPDASKNRSDDPSDSSVTQDKNKGSSNKNVNGENTTEEHNDSSIIPQEEKDARTDLTTLPEVQTEGNSNDAVAK